MKRWGQGQERLKIKPLAVAFDLNQQRFFIPQPQSHRVGDTGSGF